MSDLLHNVVTQHNALIKASYSLSLNEHRLLIAAISKIDPTSNAWQTGRIDIKVTVQEWREVYSQTNHTVYNDLRQAAFRLYQRNVRLWGDHQHGKHIRWISAWEYNKQGACVVLTFSGEMLHELMGFVNEYTKYQIYHVRGFKSHHSIRLYQLSAQFKGTGWHQLSLDDLRVMFQLGKAYNRWIDLRKRVLDVAVIEINAKTDLLINYELLKIGRAVSGVRLHISPQTELKAPVRTSESAASNCASTDPHPKQHSYSHRLLETQDKRSVRRKVTAAIMDIQDIDW